jgi:2-polyprenyl-3-methyl-5-hydroxy-6-metoxy-1,4-benzoquinol methylase
VSVFVNEHATWEGELIENMALNLEIAKKANPNSEVVFMDIGANLGTFTLSAASLGFKVYAFEPMPSNINALRYAMCK